MPQTRFSDALRLNLVCRLAHELNAELHPADVVRRVLHAAAEALGTPHASLVALKNRQPQAACALGAGQPGDPMPVLQRVLDNGLAGFVLHNLRTVVINDISANPLWLPLPDEPLSPQDGSALCVPLTHAGAAVGVMTLAHPVRSYFTADAVNLANTISELGAAALHYTLALEDLRRSEQLFSRLFDDVTLPILITDLDGTIEALNRRACEFLGYERAQLLGQNISLIHRMGTATLNAEHHAELERGIEFNFQSAVWLQDGSSRIVQVRVKRLNQATGHDRIQWIEQDITSDVEMEQVRHDLSAMVYHDMRGPLGNVYTSLEALRRLLGDQADARVQDLLEVAIRSERQVRRMVDSLLDVQRLEAGNRLISRQSTLLNDLVREAVGQLRSLADEKELHLSFALADELPVLYADGEMIERVIQNLLDNAIKYTPDQGTITISTASTGREVYVRIRDNGPGIPPEAQASIFDRFSRVRQRHMPHGVGLGLAFCKLAVEAHSGRIWVNSDATGSTFTVALPVEAPATQELPLLNTIYPPHRQDETARS